MKRLISIVLAVIFVLTATLALAGSTYVRGYFRKDGTYVRPHWRTTPNHTRSDNYGYPGNVNPNTGVLTPYPRRYNPYADPWASPYNYHR